MEKPFNNTGMMMRSLFKRDWLKYIFWLLALLMYASSGVAKLEVAISDSSRTNMYLLFNGPALVSLFGPTSVKDPAKFTGAAAFGGLMPLITVMVFAIVTIIYVINRTRKDEDEGIAELLRSFQIGKLSNTTAVVIELLVLQVVMTIALAGSIQVQNAAGMTVFSDNLLFAASITGQSFMWGMIALLFAQVFPEAGSAKGASIGLFFIFYILRMGTDLKNINLSWFNPLSWSYLTGVYVTNNWLPILYTLILSAVTLILAYQLEIHRDVAAGYLPESRGKAQAGKMLQSLTGLVLRLQRTATIFWLMGLFVGGIMYGSMISRIGDLVGGSTLLQREMAITVGANSELMAQQFLATVYLVLALVATSFAITSLSRSVNEERKNRQEQLYSLPISRFKMFANYTVTAWLLGALAMFVGVLGVYLAQAGQTNALSSGKVFSGGMAWTFGLFFVLSLLSFLMAFFPRFSAAIWVYVGLAFFIGVLGNLLNFPKWLMNLNIFNNLMKETSRTVLPNTPNWSNLTIILVIALVLTVAAYIGYRRRDLISG